ncbi:hypothetical protein D3C80_256800 [compost metagenome]
MLAIVICLSLKSLQSLHQPLRLGQFAQGQPLSKLKAGDHFVVELLIVDDGDRQCWQAEAGSLPGHAARSADGKIVSLHQLRHLVALAQQCERQIGQFGDPLLQLGPERIGSTRHQRPVDGSSPW